MNGVVGMADMLFETDLSDEQRLYLDTIKSSSEALLVIINDVLDYSKIEAERLELHPEPFDLERCIHEVVTLLWPTAQAKKLQMAVDYDMFLPTRFVGDPGRVRQILTNLIGNAIKFTETGHVRVGVVGMPQPDSQEIRVHVTVEDTGIGIPEDRLEHVFGEFNQVEEDYSRQHDGTGLGLAISRRLVGLMGGKIWVDSELGVGSGFGFHVTLPATPEQPELPERAPAWMTRAIVYETPGITQSILASQLTALGLSVETAASPDDLSARAPTDSDLIFLGFGVAGLDIAGATKALSGISATLIGVLSDLTHPSCGIELSATLRRPLLRRDLITCLEGLTPPVAPLAEVEPPTNPPDRGPRKMRILVAEDNKTNQLVLSKMLKKLNVEIEFADNGSLAVDAFKRERPDILFTDISMPIMDGKAAARKIREIEAESGVAPVPMIAVTAHALDGDAEEILASGIDEYMTKPVRKDILHAHIRANRPDDCLPVDDQDVASGAVQSAGTTPSQTASALGAS